MGIHAQAQQELASAFEAVMGRPPTKNERLFAGAIAFGESSYARAKFTNKLTGVSKVLNNWGAIQCPSNTRPCPEGSFEVSDVDVRPDGSEIPFNQCYCDDATRELAAERFIKTLYQKRPLLLAAASSLPNDAHAQLMTLGEPNTGGIANKVYDPAPLYDGHDTKASLNDPYYLHIAWFSHVMRDSKYFGLRLYKHIGAQIRYHNAIAAETGERIDGGPMADPKGEEPTPPHYSLPEFLALLLLALQDDAKHHSYMSFPPRAKQIVKDFQRSRGLNPDGVVGEKQTIPQLFKEV